MNAISPYYKQIILTKRNKFFTKYDSTIIFI